MLKKKPTDTDMSLAVFIDFENLALGFKDRSDKFEIKLVLRRLLEKGKIVAKKAYADWYRFGNYTGALHEAAIELVEIPKRGMTGKNSADIRLCVDAMDLAYSKEHISTFVIVSGDSDFSPLVSKLKELGKHVIGLGMANSTSNLLRDNCDEFIYYEDLRTPTQETKLVTTQLPETKRKAFGLLLDALGALRRENKDVMWSSMIKDTMKRIRPSFNESYHGYRTFSMLLEDAQREGLIEIDTDPRSGTYVVSRFGDELTEARATGAQRPLVGERPAGVFGDKPTDDRPPGANRPNSRGRRGRGRRGPNGPAAQAPGSGDGAQSAGTPAPQAPGNGTSHADASLPHPAHLNDAPVYPADSEPSRPQWSDASEHTDRGARNDGARDIDAGDLSNIESRTSADVPSGESQPASGGGKTKRGRRGGRGRRGRGGGASVPAATTPGAENSPTHAEPAIPQHAESDRTSTEAPASSGTPAKKSRRRKRSKKPATEG